MAKKNSVDKVFILDLLEKVEPVEYLIEQTEDGNNIYLKMKIYDCKVDKGSLDFDMSIVIDCCKKILNYIKGKLNDTN